MDASKMIFYVYVYLDTRKPGIYNYSNYIFEFEPFYVGKGSSNRKNVHLIQAYFTSNNSYKLNKIRKIKAETGKDPLVLLIKESLTEKEAFELEISLIKLIGRLDLNIGPLLNLTDGGDGPSGMIPSQESIEKRKQKYKENFEKNSLVRKELWKRQEYRQKQLERLSRQREVFRLKISKSVSIFLKSEWKKENGKYKDQSEKMHKTLSEKRKNDKNFDQQYKQKLSVAQKKNWQKEDYRRKQKENGSSRKTLKKLWKDNTYREKRTRQISEEQKRIWQEPNRRQAQSKITSLRNKQLWKNKEYRENQLNKMGKKWKITFNGEQFVIINLKKWCVEHGFDRRKLHKTQNLTFKRA